MDNFSLKGQKVSILGFVARVNVKDIVLFTYCLKHRNPFLFEAVSSILLPTYSTETC